MPDLTAPQTHTEHQATIRWADPSRTIEGAGVCPTAEAARDVAEQLVALYRSLGTMPAPTYTIELQHRTVTAWQTTGDVPA